MANQKRINELARTLKVQAIELLIKEDCLRYDAEIPGHDKMLYMVEEIYRLPVCTKKLRDLFAAAHEMHEDKGMFPHTASVGDLELVARRYGDFSGKGERFSWLPRNNDERMKMMPAFIALDKIYRAEKKAIPPVDEKSVESEAMHIVNEIAVNIGGI
jgi:hypothetical protein